MKKENDKKLSVLKKSLLVESFAIILLVVLLFIQCLQKNNADGKIAGQNASEKETTIDEKSVIAEKTTLREAALEEAALEEAAGKQTSFEEAAVEETAVEKAASKQTSLEEAAVEEASLEEAAVEEASLEEAAVGEASGKQTSIEEASFEEAAVEKAASKQTSIEEAGLPVVKKSESIALENGNTDSEATDQEAPSETLEKTETEKTETEKTEKLDSLFDSFTDSEKEASNDDLIENAAKLAREVLEKDPTNDKAYYFVAQEELKKKNYELAMQALAQAIEFNKVNYLYYYDSGKVSFLRKDFPKAAAQFEESIRLKDDFAPSWYNLGLTRLKMNMLEEALSAFKRAVSVKDDYEKGWLETARAYKRLKDFNNAINSYKRVIEINGRNLSAIMELGSLYFDECKFVDAEEMYKEALGHLNSGEEQILTKYNLSIVLIEDKKYEEARTYAWEAYDRKDVVKTDNERANITYNYGLVLELLENFQSAIEVYKEALTYNPLHVRARINLANLMMKTEEDCEKALSMLEQLYSENPQNLTVLGNLAYASFKSGAYDKAKTYYLLLIENDKENWEAYLNVAKCFIQLGDSENALRYLAYLNSKAPDFKKSEVENLLNTLL